MRGLVALCMVIVFALPVNAKDVIPLLSGEEAPHSGLLVKEKRFTEFLNAEIDVDDLTGQLAIQKRLTNSLEIMYNKRLVEAVKEPRWYETPSFNRWLGFGIGVVVSALAIYGGSRLVKAVD